MGNPMKKPQIGIMGSVADLNYGKDAERAAERVGELIAKKKGILMFGAEKDFDSLSTAACRGAKRAGGLTVGITYGRGKGIFQKEGVDVIIPCGLERGGGREFVLVSSCDAIIMISGGSGTLNEAVVAYQLGIPIVALTGYGGWADKLAGEYLDKRKRLKVMKTNTPEEAVEKAFKGAGSV
jgi:uncharacterized protein (TIGR00725 family)